MFPLILKVTGYNREKNILIAKTQTRQEVEFDPFVSCAIELSEEGFKEGLAEKLCGNTYALTSFIVDESPFKNTVQDYLVIPSENGLSEVQT